MAQLRGSGSARSSWGRPPIARSGEAAPVLGAPIEKEGEDAPGAGSEESTVRAVAAEVGAAIRGGVAPVASRVGTAVRAGIGSVERALDDPGHSVSPELLAQADLPELEGEHPLVSMGVRLDREADLWRGMAMRQLARAAWTDRLAITTALFAFAGVLIFAAIAGFRAMFASDGAVPVGLLLLTATALLIAGTWTIGRAWARIRQSQIEVARDALIRADLAEARLHRLAVLLEVRGLDPEGYPASLRAFEEDVRNA
jgi:hypothetical protein